MATEPSGDARCGIGARLRSARERSGLTILQAAEKLHADARVLEALEAEKFDELGAAVFVRGHIRRYAELVRESPTELQDMYAASSHAVARPDLTRIPTTSGARSADPRTLLIPGLLMVIAVGTIGLIWWFLTSLRTPSPQVAEQAEPVDSASAEVDTGQPTPIDAPSPPAASTAPSSGSANRNGAQIRSPVPARTAANTGQARPGAASPASPAATSSPMAPVASSATEPPENAADASPDAAETAPAVDAMAAGSQGTELALRFSGDSWAEIYDARGNRLFYDIGSADSVKTLSGTPPFRVILGNPGGVAVEVDGKSAKVPNVSGGESGIQFTINRSGRVSRARAAPNAGG